MTSSSTPQGFAWRVYHQCGLLAGERESSVELRLAGPDERKVTVSRSVNRFRVATEDRGPEVRDVEGYGYIDLTRIEDPAAFDQALSGFLDAPGLVLDMRGYPKMFVEAFVVSRLVDRPYGGVRFAVPRQPPEHRWFWSEAHSIETGYTLQPHPTLRYLGPVAVLIDERAVSQSEDFCLYMKAAGRGVFVGSPTVGTNGNVTGVSLPGGGSLNFTGMRVLHADGSPFQNVGIVPDVHVEPTIEGIRWGRDEVLDAAVEEFRRSRRDL